MEQEKKAVGLEKLYIACFRPSRYKELLAGKAAGHVLYTCFIILFLVFVEAILPFMAWDLSVGGLSRLITERIPGFTVDKGEMTIQSPVEFDIGGVLHFRADSDVEKFQKKDFEEKYPEELLCSRTNVMVKAADRIMDISMAEIAREKFDNQDLVETVPFLRLVLGIYFFSTYIIKGIEYMIAAVFFAVLCRAAIRTPEGTFVNLKGTIIIAIYAKTLFSLLYSVNICAGRPIGDTLMLILGTFGTIAFIDRAEAAVLNISRRK